MKVREAFIKKKRKKSLLTNVNKKMVFFNEGFPNGTRQQIVCKCGN